MSAGIQHPIDTELVLEPRSAASPLRSAEQSILSVRASVPAADVAAFIAEALHDVRAFMQEHHLAAAGPPFSVCRPDGDTVDVEAGWPTAGAPHAGGSRIHGGSLPGAFTVTGRLNRALAETSPGLGDP